MENHAASALDTFAGAITGVSDELPLLGHLELVNPDIEIIDAHAAVCAAK
jgi:hypothetical protein